MTSNTRWAAAFAVVAGMAITTSAHAVWSFTGVSLDGTASVGADATGYGVKATGYASSATAPSIVATDAGSSWATQSLLFYSGGGLAMNSDGATSPNHAIDGTGKTEAVLLKFDDSVVLSNISLGYAVNSSKVNAQVDVSLFRYTGTLATPPMGTIGSMAGWELVGNYGDLTNGGSNAVNVATVAGGGLSTTGGSGGKGSSWWLISAYNTNFVASSPASQTRGSLDNGNDYFKILAVSGTKCTSTVAGVCSGGGSVTSVPEPASLALASVSLMGLFGIRRRNNNKQA